MIKRLLLLTLAKLVLCHNALAATQAYPMPRTHVVPITNAVTGGQYELFIKLPESYNSETDDADTDKTYPVIYTTDAYWHMDLLSGTTEFIMPEVILDKQILTLPLYAIKSWPMWKKTTALALVKMPT